MFHGNPTLEIASGLKVLRDRIAGRQDSLLEAGRDPQHRHLERA
jgi:hypothetical protein